MVPGRRSVNADLANYLKAVNEIMLRTHGVRYEDVYAELDGGLDRLAGAYTSGQSPSQFVEATGEIFGLIECSSFTAELACEYNKRKTALVEFSRESGDWTLAADGRVYQELGDNLCRIDPIYNSRSKCWGFAVILAEGASLVSSGDEVLPPEDVEFKRVAAAVDIGDACQRLNDYTCAAPAMGR